MNAESASQLLWKYIRALQITCQIISILSVFIVFAHNEKISRSAAIGCIELVMLQIVSSCHQGTFQVADT